MYTKFLLFTLFLLKNNEIFANQAKNDSNAGPLVKVPGLGSARGKYMKTLSDRTIQAFLGIPYAIPPEKFQYTKVWEKKWNKDDTEFDATYLRSKCLQASSMTGSSVGNLNCLTLSVYRPNKNITAKPLPVVVFVHGGSFSSGDASLYTPTKMLQHDVIFVVIQYRHGLMGFMYSGTKDSPGNMGLHDTYLSLKWVKKYISNFGGDSKHISLIGQSAGAATVSHLQLSPMTHPDKNDGQELFQKVVLMSGSAYDLWTLDVNPGEGFIRVVKAAGCHKEEDKSKMVECMKKLTDAQLIAVQMEVIKGGRKKGEQGFLGVNPVIQDPSVGDIIMINKRPKDTIYSKDFRQVPMMISVTKDEGSIFLAHTCNDFLEPNHHLDDEVYMSYKIFDDMSKCIRIYDRSKAASSSFNLAFYNENIQDYSWHNIVGGLVDAIGVLFLKSGINGIAHAISSQIPDYPIYFYGFDFVSDDSVYPWLIKPTKYPIDHGTAHADDLLLMFNMPGYIDARKKKMSLLFTTLLYNFFAVSNPTPAHENNWIAWAPRWPKFDSKKGQYMRITDDFNVETNIMRHWNYHKYLPQNTTADPNPTPEERMEL